MPDADEVRAQHRLYLDMAPGVRKTYAALLELRRRKQEGTDAVVAYVETYNRIGTIEALGDLEVVPRRKIPYKGLVLEDMDLDAVLSRKPHFEYIAGRAPEMLVICQRVAAVPMKCGAPAETRFLERDEVQDLVRTLPRDGRLALRDRALILFLYNTGARVQETADLRIEHLDLGDHPLVRLHAKVDKWRTYPLWHHKASLLASLLQSMNPPPAPKTPVFSAQGQPLTRFGIYKIVRRHGARFDNPHTARRVSPHIFRHTAAVHLLEAGVEINVIRGWLGHADLTTTNRYAEINTKTKLAALRASELSDTTEASRTNPIWRTDESLLNWLASL